MDRWKSRGGKSQRREEKKREDQTEKRKSQQKEDAGVRKGRKVANHCVFQWFGAPEVESRLAKAAGAEPSGQMRDEKLHAAVARSTFRSQNVQSTPSWEHFWKLTCRKNASCCGAKHISKKMHETPQCRTTFGSWHVEKVQAVVARSIFPNQNVKSATCSDHFEG